MITFKTVDALEEALLRAEVAHAIYEKKLGYRDDYWAAWYAQFIDREQRVKS